MASKFHFWKIGSVNIRTGKEDQKLENVVHQIHKAGLSICALQEVRRLRSGSCIIESNFNDVLRKYEVYWSGNKMKRIHGVGIVVCVDSGIEVIEVIQVNQRMIVLEVKVHGIWIKIINCYAPTEDAKDSTKDAFYHDLNKQMIPSNKKMKVICLGDFNATTSAAWYNSSLREGVEIEDLEVNNNGERFHYFFNNHSLSVLNTWFTHRKCRRITWHSADRRTKKVIDFIRCCSWIRQYVTNCRVYNSFDFDSDHCLLVAHLHTPAEKVSRYIKRSAKKKKYIDLTSLNTPAIRYNYIEAVNEDLQTLTTSASSSNDEINTQFIKIINNAANSTIPSKEKEIYTPPWHDDEILKELYMLRDKQKREGNDIKLVAITTKKIRKGARFLRDQHFKAEAEKINQFAINRELSKLFVRAKKQESTLKRIPVICPANDILEHFKSHFNPHDPSTTRTPDGLSSNIPIFITELQEISRNFNINNEPPSVEEIKECLNKLKNNKASNDIAPELLKHCGTPIMIEVLHCMMGKLWREMDIATAWGNSRLKNLWKGKGSKKNPKNHRGLSIGSTVCKVIIMIILERLRAWYEAQLTDEQNGFRRDRGTTDGIFTAKRVQQITDKKKQPLFVLFVDLTAAFDHIPRKWLFDSIKLRFHNGENLKLFDILENIYKNTSLTYEESDTTFTTTSGVRQGGPESPFLFDLYVDFAMRVYKEECKKESDIKFFEHKYRFNARTASREERLKFRNQSQMLHGSDTLSWSGYADDLILFLLDQLGLQKATILLDEVFANYGLSINNSKTETMIINHKYLSSLEYPKTIISLNNMALKNVETFKYLGAHLHHNEPCTGDTEINHRIQMAYVKFAEMSNLLQNFKVNLYTRILFLNCFVRSRLTYACQTWNLNSLQYQKLDVSYRLLLRKMVRSGFKRCNDDISGDANDFKMKISNNKLHDICATSDVSLFIKQQQENYAEHLIRTDWSRATKKLLFNDDRYKKTGRSVPSLLDQVVRNGNTTVEAFCNHAMNKKKMGIGDEPDKIL